MKNGLAGAMAEVIAAAEAWADDLPEQEPYDEGLRAEKEAAATKIRDAVAELRKAGIAS